MVAQNLQGNVRVSGAVTNSGLITMASGSSTDIVPANENRRYLSITNHGNQNVLIKWQDDTVDDLDTGEICAAGTTWRMPENFFYTGIVSGIALADAPEVSFIEG